MIVLAIMHKIVIIIIIVVVVVAIMFRIEIEK